MKTTRFLPILLAALSAGVTCPADEHPVQKYAWSFRNFRSDPCVPGSAFYDWDLYMQTYIGIPAEPANNFGFDYLWFKVAYEQALAGPGNCYGMSLLSAMINEKGGHLGFCGPVNQYAGDTAGVEAPMCDKDPDDDIPGWGFLGPYDPVLRRAIEEMHGHQLNLTTVRHQLEQFGKGFSQNAEVAYETVLLEKAQGRTCVISMIKQAENFFGAGHAVLAYDARKDPASGQKRIYVYDPNRPWPLQKSWYDPDPETDKDYYDGENYIEVNGNNYKFHMGGGEYWPEGPGLITAFRLSLTAPRDRTPASLGTSAGQLVTKLLLAGSAGGGPASLTQVTSADGRTLFVAGTRSPQTDQAKGLPLITPLLLSDELPESLESGAVSERYAIFDPPAGGLDFDVASGDDGYELVLASRGSRVVVRAKGGRGTDRVRLQDIGTLSPRVLLFNRLGAEMDVEIDRPAGVTGVARNFRLRRIAMPRGGLLEIGLGDQGKTLDVTSPLHETGFELELGLEEGRTQRTSRLAPVLLGAGEEGSFAPDDWSDPSQGDLVSAIQGLSLAALEAYSDFADGPGSGAAGEHFATTRDVGGASGGRTLYDPRTGEYTQTSSGADIGPGGDSFHFAYDMVAGDFEFTVEILDRMGPVVRQQSLAKHGLMARKDSTREAKYSLLETRLFGAGLDADEDWPRWSYRRLHGDAEAADSTDDRQKFNYDPDQAPRFLKMVRRGKTFHGFFSPDGLDWRPTGSDTWYGEGAGSSVLVGFASTSGPDATGPTLLRFKVLGLGPIDPALEPLLPEGAEVSGAEVYRNEFASVSGSPPPAMRVNRRAGEFTPQVRNGRLRLSDEGAPGSAVSAFGEHVIEDLDSAVHHFDFDLFLARRTGFDPGEGITFVVTGGPELDRVGFAAGGLGYDLLGREPITDRNVGRTGFAVEIDTARGAGDAEGAGSPDAPRSFHVGINGFGNVNTVVFAEEQLPDPFTSTGAHVRVAYNRGRVTVHMGPGGAGPESLVKVLSADLLPVSFASPEPTAVFGFTAGTGTLTQTAEVDNLVATRLDCADAPELAVIAGVPVDPAPVGSIVTLDGSFSNGGAGDEEEGVSLSWRVTSGPAAIEGPSDGPTVNLKVLAEGDVAVELAADDGQCGEPATARAMFAATAATGNWLRCDADGNGQRNITDPIVTLGWLFLGQSGPRCLEALDCMKDGRVNITDPIYDLSYLFMGGPPPAAPYPACDTFGGCEPGCR
jgi:hypothetical protein